MRYFEILAATAYKEFAHSLSNKSLQKLKDAGLNIGEAAVEKAQNTLRDKYKLDIVHGQAKTGYMPNKTERVQMPDTMKISGLFNDHNSGKITINDNQYNELSEYNKKMVKYHEALEKHYFPTFKLNTYKGLGHVNTGVLLQERRLYNQAGVQDKNYLDIRKSTGEFQYLTKRLPKDGRITSKDYKRAISRTNKEIEDGAVNYRFKISKNIARNKASSEKQQAIIDKINTVANTNGLYNAVNYFTKRNQMYATGNALDEHTRAAAMKINLPYHKLQEYLNKRDAKMNTYYKNILKTNEDLEAMGVYASTNYI